MRKNIKIHNLQTNEKSNINKTNENKQNQNSTGSNENISKGTETSVSHIEENNKNKNEMNQKISMRFKYKDLTPDSYILLELYSMQLPQEKALLGTTKIYLFNDNFFNSSFFALMAPTGQTAPHAMQP